jgi:hypothetical protein
MIGMRMRGVNRGEMLARFENLSGQLVRFAQRELRVDQDDVALAGDHRRVDVNFDCAPGAATTPIAITAAANVRQIPIPPILAKWICTLETTNDRVPAGALAHKKPANAPRFSRVRIQCRRCPCGGDFSCVQLRLRRQRR